MNVWIDYLAKLNDSQKQLVVHTLELAKKYSPDALEAMPYGVPGLKLHDKPLIAVAAHKEHYGVYPFSPKVVEAVKPLIGNLPTAKGTIRFDYAQVPSEDLIKKLVELRTKEIL